MRLIDADALIECLQTWKTAAVSEGLPINERFAVAMIAQVNLMPTIEPERKKGEWILVTDGNGQHYVCDHCGQWRYHQGQKFCSECGLKMEEGEQG